MVLGSVQVKEHVLHAGDIELDDQARSVKLMGESVSLTPKEYGILKFLMENRGKVFSPRAIYEKVWGGKSLRSRRNSRCTYKASARETGI